MSETITINIDVLGTGTSMSVSMQRAREIYEELKAIFDPVPRINYRESEPASWRTCPRPTEGDPNYWWKNDPSSTPRDYVGDGKV